MPGATCPRSAGPLLVVLAALCVACGDPRPPSVVLFVIDTLRADRVGAYGYGAPTTPQIDALARESVLFEQAYAPAPWTLPSVVSLLTSTYACEHGVTVDGLALHPDIPTLAERLADAGYATASFHANAYAGSVSGLDRGFAVSELLPYTEGDQVEAWLDRVGERPFFLYVHNVEPHDAYIAPFETVQRFGSVSEGERARVNKLLNRFRRLTRADFEQGQLPGATDNTGTQRAVLSRMRSLGPALSALYDGDIHLADERLGSVVAALERRGVWDDAIFVLVSDHGEELMDHGGLQHDQSVYEELIRVPLILRLPAGEAAGTRIPQVVSLVDVAPTILDRVGLPTGGLPGRSGGLPGRSGGLSGQSGGLSGESLLPLIAGGRQSEGGIASVRINRKKYFRPFRERRGDVNVALRDGSWKGIWNAEPARIELFDLASDAGELRDVSIEHPERAQAMAGEARRWLAACRERSRQVPPRPAGEIGEAERDRLRALGYVP
jgi:arylsulfatase A-like enzyme